jgi:hypothetical protein
MTDPEDDTKDTKVIGVIKANYGRMPYPWRFQIVSTVIQDADGNDIDTSRIVWLSKCDKHLDAIAEKAKTRSGVKGASTRWADQRAQADRDIFDILTPGELFASEALAEMDRRGHPERAARAAAARCRVVITRPGGNTGPYVWRLPQQQPGRQGSFQLP